MRARLGCTIAATALLVAGCGGGDGEDEGKRVALDSVGMSVQAPAGWETSTDETSIELKSPDDKIAVTVSSPLPGREPKAVKEAVARQLAEQYAPVKVVTQDDTAKLGERTVRSFVLQGSQQGIPVNVVTLIEDTQYRTYAVIALTASLSLPEKSKPTEASLGQLRDTLRSIEFYKPTETGQDDQPE